MSADLVLKDGSVEIWSLLGSGDSRRVEALLTLYARLFPQYAHYVPRMRRRAAFGAERRAGHIVHYWLVEVDGQPAGLRTFRYVRDRHVGLAHALAVDPAYRGQVVGGQRLSIFLVNACLDQIIADARAVGDLPALGIANEVESPKLMQHYRKHGALELPVKYVEPIFPPEQGHSPAELSQIRFSPMALGFLPDPALQLERCSNEMISDFSLAFLADHYGLPVEHPQVQAVLDSIPVLS
ncbi:MAG TPA: GNAT family N-acetyltransferase [Anaerolineales bacterium]|jgi:GNAT superfamily N-acetyltransferase